jgi:steroid delta-isomerase-like uncharacterized protein
MSIEENIAVVRRFNEGLATYFRTGDDTAMVEVMHPDVAVDIPGMPSTLATLRQVLPAFRTAFPDFQVTVDDYLADDTRVAYRVTWTATHSGELMGIPPTGKRIRVTETHIDHLVDGKIVRHEGDWDQLGMLHQAGAIPMPGQAPG